MNASSYQCTIITSIQNKYVHIKQSEQRSNRLSGSCNLHRITSVLTAALISETVQQKRWSSKRLKQETLEHLSTLNTYWSTCDFLCRRTETHSVPLSTRPAIDFHLLAGGQCSLAVFNKANTYQWRGWERWWKAGRHGAPGWGHPRSSHCWGRPASRCRRCYLLHCRRMTGPCHHAAASHSPRLNLGRKHTQINLCPHQESL